MKTKSPTSWQGVGKWYQNLVKNQGHYYHEHVVIPGVLKLLNLKPGSSVLDLACGQGILAKRLPKDVRYIGIDSAPNLIDYAKKSDTHSKHHYLISDITQPLQLKQQFNHATLILSLQNIAEPQKVFQNANLHLKPTGTMVIVLNHPYFRIPRQTIWGIDEVNKMQYRRVNRYLSPLKIPITMHPGKQDNQLTWSFHFPLSMYSHFLHNSGFTIDTIEEWISNKESVGKKSKMENLARNEIPLFMAIVARKSN